MAGPPIIDAHRGEDTGRHRRPSAPATADGPGPGGAPGLDRARAAVWAMAGVWAGVFAWLSVARHQAFATGRFDLGNMVQAVWSTADGRFLDTTDVEGLQFTRLGAHVDPVLALFTPLWWLWPSPEVLLVAQAVIVASGALPAFWLGRRWLGDDRLAVAGAAVYLLLPAVQAATLFDFHPVTLAAPLLMFCLWAVEEARWWTLGVCATLAALSQEQVGLLLVMLAAWMAVRHPGRRRAAAILGTASLTWVVVAMTVVMPAFALDGNPHLSRYEALGDGPLDILATLVLRPWEALEVVATGGRALYLAGLLLPLLLLPLAAPLLAAVTLPQLFVNLFASTGPPQTVEYHYGVLIGPILVAATLLGLARIRSRRRPAWATRLTDHAGRTAAALVVAVVAAGAWLGPLPLWGWLPGGWDGGALHRFARDEHGRALASAVAMVPDDAPVSATNEAGAHLSERRRIHLFPRIGDATWVVVDLSPRARAVADERPTLRPPETDFRLGVLSASEHWELVFERDDVRVYRRRADLL